MGRKDKRKKFEFKDDEDDLLNCKPKVSKSAGLVSSDEEANADLSLKIVEKALLSRAAELVPDGNSNRNGSGEVSGNNGGSGDGVVKIISASLEEPKGSAGTSGASGNGVVADSEVRELGSKKTTKRKKKKDKKLGTGEDNVVVTEGQKAETTGTIDQVDPVEPKATEIADNSVFRKLLVVVTEEQKVETTGTIDQVDPVEPKTTEIADNSVFRKLLRGPRYFDPPDSWGACFNCGEEGHNAVNCTLAKRRRPCFVCGSLEHNAKDCSKGRDCFICKKGGHRAKDCPEKHGDISSSSKVCLKCGNSGHDMFSCQNPYSDYDLQNIQCYICKRFGHICCMNSTSDTPIEVSCYKCGQIGHTGLACSRLRGEASSTASHSLCYRCGEEGHFARECTNSTKGGKRNRDLSNTKVRSQIEEVNPRGSKSAPHSRAKGHKKKKPNYEENCTPYPRNSGHGGRWMMEDPGNFSNGTSKKTYWNSPVTPSNRYHNNYSEYNGDYASPRSYSKIHNFHTGTPVSLGSGRSFQNRFSASRFGDYSSVGRNRNYGWW